MGQTKQAQANAHEAQRLSRIEEKLDSMSDAVVRLVALNEGIPARVQILEGDNRQQHTLVGILAERVAKVEARVADHDKDRLRLEGGWWLLLKIGGWITVIVGTLAWLWTNVVMPFLQRNHMPI